MHPGPVTSTLKTPLSQLLKHIGATNQTFASITTRMVELVHDAS
jgi:hypothetical protein